MAEWLLGCKQSVAVAAVRRSGACCGAPACSEACTGSTTITARTSASPSTALIPSSPCTGRAPGSCLRIKAHIAAQRCEPPLPIQIYDETASICDMVCGNWSDGRHNDSDGTTHTQPSDAVNQKGTTTDVYGAGGPRMQTYVFSYSTAVSAVRLQTYLTVHELSKALTGSQPADQPTDGHVAGAASNVKVGGRRCDNAAHTRTCGVPPQPARLYGLSITCCVLWLVERGSDA